MEDGKTEEKIYRNHYTEKIEIDKDVRIIVEILDEIMAQEPPDGWIFQVLQDLKKGKSDVSIIIKSPVSRAKFYLVKENLVNKVYKCCIFKGLVPYEDILHEEIG